MQENISINIQKVKIAVTIPRNSTQKLRDAICNAGAGIIGNYTYHQPNVLEHLSQITMLIHTLVNVII